VSKKERDDTKVVLFHCSPSLIQFSIREEELKEVSEKLNIPHAVFNIVLITIIKVIKVAKPPNLHPISLKRKAMKVILFTIVPPSLIQLERGN
jgi:hypothetical protein